MNNLDLPTKKTWCPGCGNFGMISGIEKAILDLGKEGIKKDNFVLVAGIGCHAKIIDYLNINSFYGLHGRTVPVAFGIKTANPDLKVICISGDGDSYNEGISHLIHAAKRNLDITVIIFDNRTFALTVGQFTATSPQGFKGKSTPEGSIEKPFNPLELMLASGATFIARGYSAKTDHLANLISQAVKHRGFSFVEVLQPCVAWFNTFAFYNEKTYESENTDPSSKDKATEKIREWDYINDKKIPLGVFYKVERPTFGDELMKSKSENKVAIQEVLKSHL